MRVNQYSWNVEQVTDQQTYPMIVLNNYLRCCHVLPPGGEGRKKGSREERKEGRKERTTCTRWSVMVITWRRA